MRAFHVRHTRGSWRFRGDSGRPSPLNQGAWRVSPRSRSPPLHVFGVWSAPGLQEAWMGPGGISGLCRGDCWACRSPLRLVPPASRDCLVGRPGGSAGARGPDSLALAEVEDLSRTPPSELIPEFSLLSPSTPALLPSPPPRRKRPFLAEFPAVQLQRDPKRPESGGRPHVARDLCSLRRVDPVEEVPQDGVQNSVPGRGRPPAQERDRLLSGL